MLSFDVGALVSLVSWIVHEGGRHPLVYARAALNEQARHERDDPLLRTLRRFDVVLNPVTMRLHHRHQRLQYGDEWSLVASVLVLDTFRSIVELNAGPHEKHRAAVWNCPGSWSSVLSLPIYAALACWHSPRLRFERCCCSASEAFGCRDQECNRSE
jgi:hypothetical protein